MSMEARFAVIDSVVFDLDGTLWDTCPTCAIGWNNVLRRHGIAFREITQSGADRRFSSFGALTDWLLLEGA